MSTLLLLILVEMLVNKLDHLSASLLETSVPQVILAADWTLIPHLNLALMLFNFIDLVSRGHQGKILKLGFLIIIFENSNRTIHRLTFSYLSVFVTDAAIIESFVNLFIWHILWSLRLKENALLRLGHQSWFLESKVDHFMLICFVCKLP